MQPFVTIQLIIYLYKAQYMRWITKLRKEEQNQDVPGTILHVHF
jgi:hypothetical protein